MVENDEGLGLDGDASQGTTPDRAVDKDGTPYCRRHHCHMKVRSGGRRGSRTNYYGCPVPGCGEKEQMVRAVVETVVPPTPQKCPRCKGDQYCERDDRVSTAAVVILRCPSCGWKSPSMAAPLFAAQMQRHRARRTHQAPEGLGER